MAKPHGPDVQLEFGKKIINGTKPSQAYEEVTGTTGHSAVVGAGKWLKLPEIQKIILQNTQERLLKAGELSVKRLEQGLRAINPKKMTGTSINLIKLGMQMSGLLDKKIDVNVTETQTLDPKVLAALEHLGQTMITDAQELKEQDDGSFAVTGDSEQAGEPADS